MQDRVSSVAPVEEVHRTTPFKPFAEAVQKRFIEMSAGELFVVKCDDIFDRYLAAFPAGTNPMFRQRTEHDCNCCKQFVRRLGVVVAIKNGRVITVWGDLDLSHAHKAVADALDAHIRTLPIESVFRTKERHNCDLDTIAKAVNSELKEMGEESFVEDVSANPRKKALEVALEILKDVIKTKQDENAAKLLKAKKVELRTKIMDAIQAKQDQKLTESTVEELQQQLAALDA